ncbi:MAG: alpha/beta hydrolase [Lachnospiraceae bacterium]|nr:alpha/beta hydrolase [Lachnospiraceae bacterium]
MSQISEKIRNDFKKYDDIRDAGLTTPEDILRYDNIVYGSDPKWQVLDVYRPANAEKNTLPVIVSVHGGGWVYGDKERYQYYCMNLAQRGFAVVNFTYRLAPENKFPASLEDTNAVFEWVLANSGNYGLDTEHIFAVGDSAGAHNLGIYVNLCTNPAYRTKFKIEPPANFVPAAIALNCGVYRVESDGDEQTTALMKEYLPEGGSEKELEMIQVTDYITEKFPPAFLMTCTDDFLKGQAPLLAEKFLSKNIPFLFRFYGDAKNMLPHVFHCDIKSEEAKLCNDEECNFFKSFL